MMKRILIAVLFLVFAAGVAMAEGGKEHGDKGKGKTRQVVGP